MVLCSVALLRFASSDSDDYEEDSSSYSSSSSNTAGTSSSTTTTEITTGTTGTTSPTSTQLSNVSRTLSSSHKEREGSIDLLRRDPFMSFLIIQVIAKDQSGNMYVPIDIS
jgi:hypothetical protein